MWVEWDRLSLDVWLMEDLQRRRSSLNKRLETVAALANLATYDSQATRTYVDGAPHIKHASLRTLYATLLTQAYDHAAKYSETPRVLDLGAGEGSATLPLLELGARVTAVDVSESQLDALRGKCARFADRLEVRCETTGETLRTRGRQYDIIVASSFLHHIPDYLGLIRQAILVLTPHGQFFSFQDPLRYDTVGVITKIFGDLAYFSWRVFKRDVWGGLKRRLRRRRGLYCADLPYDNVEYHVTRNGVDQDAIAVVLTDAGFECEIVRYFSTQSRLCQPLGSAMEMKNTFAVMAKKLPA